MKNKKLLQKAIFMATMAGMPLFADVAPTQADQSFLNTIFGLIIYALKAILAILVLVIALSWAIIPYFAYRMVDKYYKRKEDTAQEDLSREKQIAIAVAVVGGIIVGFLFIGGVGMLAFHKTSLFDGISAFLGSLFSNAIKMVGASQ